MTTFDGVKAKKFILIHIVIVLNFLSLGLNKKVSQINARLWRLLTEKTEVNKGCILKELNTWYRLYEAWISYPADKPLSSG